MSALTKNQVIAFVLGVAVCFVFAVASYPLVTDFLVQQHRRCWPTSRGASRSSTASRTSPAASVSCAT